jgi:ATP-binding cassette subfamily F protein uup
VAQKKLSYKEQKELEDLEARIPQIETEVERLTQSLLEIDSSNYIEIQTVTKSIESLNAEMDTVMERWLELSEK